MPNYFKGTEFERVENGEIIATDVCLIVGSRTITGDATTIRSLDLFDEKNRQRIVMALELVGGSAETISDYLFVYGVSFDSTTPNSVTDITGLMIKKQDISAISYGGYFVSDGKWTEEEIKVMEAQSKKVHEEIAGIVQRLKREAEENRDTK